MSPFVLVIIVGGWNDRAAAVTSIDMPSEVVCVREAKAARNEIINFGSKVVFCVSREEK